MMHASRATGSLAHLEGAMKVGLLGTGFGIAHARIYHTHPEVSEVVAFGRTPAKLQAFADEFGYATTDLSSIYDDPTIDLVDVCLPTPLHAEHVLRALHAGKHVLCELPLATTMADARRILDTQAASDRQVFVDMFGRFDPATEFLHTAIAYTAVVDHVIACCQGRETSRLGPASVLDTLQLTLNVHTALAAPKRP
jgi:predicted dehydrogenase